MVWGVGGVALLYFVFNWLVERLSRLNGPSRLQPFVFVGPAMAMLLWFLALPARAHVCISVCSAATGRRRCRSSLLFTLPAEYFGDPAARFVGLQQLRGRLHRSG